MSDGPNSVAPSRPPSTVWRTRGFISVTLLLQSLVVAVSGVVRYASPRGREAHWVDWRVWGLDKDQWSSIHMVSGLVFLVLFAVHLVYNWTPMLKYLCLKGKSLRYRGWESAAGVVLTLVLLGLTVADVSPVNALFIQSERLKDAYAASIERAPWPHAEEASVETICNRFEIPLEEALALLKEKGLPVLNSTETLASVGRRHGTSAMNVFRVVRQLAPASATQSSADQDDDAPGCGAGRRQRP